MILGQITGGDDQIKITLLRQNGVQHRVIAAIGIDAEQSLIFAGKKVGICYLQNPDPGPTCHGRFKQAFQMVSFVISVCLTNRNRHRSMRQTVAQPISKKLVNLMLFVALMQLFVGIIITRFKAIDLLT
ncbi:hypothetical protein D3C80_383450 [compost metagenome]